MQSSHGDDAQIQAILASIVRLWAELTNARRLIGAAETDAAGTCRTADGTFSLSDVQIEFRLGGFVGKTVRTWPDGMGHLDRQS